ncbi:MAG: hypothetical protein R3217_08885 [Gammaproteobacteria bacterium]|nr:hypothetical protein [Gammaproteobacteria bacterium]
MTKYDKRLFYEGTLSLSGGYRVIVISLDSSERAFAIAPNGYPLARTGYPSIDSAKQQIAEFRDAGKSPDTDRLAPSALPPDQRLPLEPVMDTVMRVEIRGIFVALLGVLLGGDAVLWILELPARPGVGRTAKIYRDEEDAVRAYENLCVELSTKYIDAYLPPQNDDE